jgi:hypothetical protein
MQIPTRSFGDTLQYLLVRRLRHVVALLRSTDLIVGHLPHRRTAQQRIIHDELRSRVRHVHRLPGKLPASVRSRRPSDLRAFQKTPE